MKRRTFLSTALALPAVAQTDAPATPLTRWARSAQHKRDLTQGIAWPTHEALAFLLRRGGNPDDVVEHWEAQHNPENFKRMAAAGIRYCRLHFYKGLGLATEAPEIEQTKRTAAIMHQYGMKVSLYMAGTMFVETFYREVPEAKDWEQRDQNGHWVPYTQTQTYRHYPCPNEPKYRDYLKRVLKIGIEDVKADQIVFDNVMLQPEPHSCHCPRCVRAFHAMLQQRYPTKEAARRRFGIAEVEWLQAPEWDSPTSPDAIASVTDPVMQEWIRFRAESLARHCNDLHDYIKSLKPSVSVGYNIKGLYSFNRIWVNAVYHPLYAGHADFLCYDTSGYYSRIDPATGALVSQIRSYKMTRRLGIGVEEGLSDELHAAVHMAFNYEKPVPGFGIQGGPFMGYNIFTPFMEFFREYNDRYCTGTENVADVAVFRNWPSMAYSISANWIPVTLAEQILIQYKVPFDILHEEQIDRLPRYGAVILAAQDCLSQTQIDRLLAYVKGGGTLLVAGPTGEYNEFKEKRRGNPLAGRVINLGNLVAGARAAKGKAGDGDTEITAGVDQSGRRFSPPQWVLPDNHAEIYRAIVAALPKGLSVTTEAPLTTIAEMYTRPESRETILHFVNFDKKTKPAPFAVTCRTQFPVKSVTLFSPDADDPLVIPHRESSGTVTFTVPATRLYAMLVIA